MSLTSKTLGLLCNIEVYHWRKASTSVVDYRSCRWSGYQQIREKGKKYQNFSSFWGRYSGVFFYFKEVAPENKQGFYYHVFSHDNPVGPFESPDEAIKHRTKFCTELLLDNKKIVQQWFQAHPEFQLLIDRKKTETKTIFRVNVNFKPFKRFNGWYYAKSLFRLAGPFKDEWSAQEARYRHIIDNLKK